MGGATRFKHRHDRAFIVKPHPNFVMPTPEKGEDAVAFALRCAGEWISPPQVPNESFTIECVDLKKQIIQLGRAVREAWDHE